jgi:hypothetical protein
MNLAMKEKTAAFEAGALAHRQEFIKSETGLPITMKINWESFGDLTEKQFETVDGMTSEIATKLSSIASEPVAKPIVTEKIGSVEIKNDPSITVPEDFVVTIENKVLTFAANFEIFVNDNTSSHKSFSETVKGML